MNKTLSRREFLKVSGGTIAGVSALALAGCGARGGGAAGGGSGGSKSYSLKLSHVAAADTPKGLAAQRFKKVLQKKSGGQIKVQVYPNSQLYGDDDELQALQSNSVQIIAPSVDKFSRIAPEVELLALPFLFDSLSEIPKIVPKSSKAGQAVYNNKKLAKKGMQVLGLWDNGLKQLTSGRQMKAPADLKGQKFRIAGKGVVQSYMQDWGVNTTVMAFSEVFTALQQGTIDGEENTYSNIYSQKFYTVQSNLTQSDHSYSGYALLVNKSFLGNLPKKLQQAVTKSADEATAYNRSIAEQTNQKDKSKIKQAGGTAILELSSSQRNSFKKVVVPKVWEQYADTIGKDIIQELRKKRNV